MCPHTAIFFSRTGGLDLKAALSAFFLAERIFFFAQAGWI
jgi:hypothetical protein